MVATGAATEIRHKSRTDRSPARRTILPATFETGGPEARLPRCETGLPARLLQWTYDHIQVGYPLGVWRSNDFARCGRGLTTVSFGGTNHDVGTACAGAPDGALYIGANGFPINDPTSRAIGNAWPDWTGGISANLRIKGVELSAFLDHRNGGHVLNMTRFITNTARTRTPRFAVRPGRSGTTCSATTSPAMCLTVP